MADMKARNQKGSRIGSTGSKPSVQNPPKVATIQKGKARSSDCACITGSNTGKVQKEPTIK